MSELHGAVALLAKASRRLHVLGLARGSRVIDRAVGEVGLALYGANVRTTADARAHIRAALRLLARVPGTAMVRRDLRGALFRMGGA